MEGKIKLGFSNTIIKKTLLPGDQSSFNFDNKNIDIKKVDTDASIAWKNGYFIFDNEPIEDVLKEVSRWYHVEIEYQNQSIKKASFNGTLSKYGNLSKVLSKLQLAGPIKFRVEGRVIFYIKLTSNIQIRFVSKETKWLFSEKSLNSTFCKIIEQISS